MTASKKTATIGADCLNVRFASAYTLGSLERRDDYERIFSGNYPIDIYWVCAKIMKLVDAYMKSEQASLPVEEKNNLGFHVAMAVALMKTGKIDYRPDDITKIDLESLSPELLAGCLEQVVTVFQQLRKEGNRQLDVLAKNRESTNAVLKHFGPK